MQFIDLQGHIIHYHWQPSNNERTFVFINSLGTDFRIWEEVSESLKDYGNILMFDNRGHGLSDVVPGTKSLSDFADDVALLLKELRIESSIIIGLSVGGMIAILLAEKIPERIEKLVLCDTCHIIGNAQIWNERIQIVEKEGFTTISEGVMQRWFSRRFNKENKEKVAGYKNMFERNSREGYNKTCETIRDADLTEAAKNIQIPTLCIVGAEDQSTTVDEVRNLGGLIKGSQFQVIEGSGHIPCVDNPQKLIELIKRFVND